MGHGVLYVYPSVKRYLIPKLILEALHIHASSSRLQRLQHVNAQIIDQGPDERIDCPTRVIHDLHIIVTDCGVEALVAGLQVLVP